MTSFQGSRIQTTRSVPTVVARRGTAAGIGPLPSQYRQRSSSSCCYFSHRNSNIQLDSECLKNTYILLRHGRSEANEAGLIASDPSIACDKYGLSEDIGRAQAHRAGRDAVEWILQQRRDGKEYDGILILSSDLLRAKETATILFSEIIIQVQKAQQEFQLPPVYTNSVVIERRLRERYFGDWDMTSDSNYEKVWKDDAVDPSHTFQNVESVNSVVQRTTECIQEWETLVSNHVIFCVAHGDVLQILQTAFLGQPASSHRSIEHLETATLRPMLGYHHPNR